jgi:LmbE family N-acetylglucosaminyl deacetylase
MDGSEFGQEVSGVADFEDVALPADHDGPRGPGDPSPGAAGPVVRPPWQELETIRPLTLRACRRIVVVAPHPRDEIRAAGGLLRRLASRHAEVDVLSLTERPTRTCPSPSTGDDTARDGRLPDADPVPVDPDTPDPAASFTLEDLLAGRLDDRLDVADDEDDHDDAVPDDEPADPDEVAAEAAYRALGLSVVRRHRLGLPDGGVAAAEADVVGAISEIVGFVEDPSGLCVLAPWSGDGDDDHEAAGRAAEIVTAAYRVRLVRWLDRAWSWAGPDSDEVPWRRARQIPLSETVIARKHAASEAFSAALGVAGTLHDLELPDGSAPGPREVFLV